MIITFIITACIICFFKSPCVVAWWSHWLITLIFSNTAWVTYTYSMHFISFSSQVSRTSLDHEWYHRCWDVSCGPSVTPPVCSCNQISNKETNILIIFLSHTPSLFSTILYQVICGVNFKYHLYIRSDSWWKYTGEWRFWDGNFATLAVLKKCVRHLQQISR